MPKTIAHLALELPWNCWLEIDWLIEPRDLWIGLYWKPYPSALDLFVCVLPCLPVEIYVVKRQ